MTTDAERQRTRHRVREVLNGVSRYRMLPDSEREFLATAGANYRLTFQELQRSS